jgi:hypothetical protein
MNIFAINRLSLSGEECQIFSWKILSWAVPSLFDLCFSQRFLWEALWQIDPADGGIHEFGPPHDRVVERIEAEDRS